MVACTVLDNARVMSHVLISMPSCVLSVSLVLYLCFSIVACLSPSVCQYCFLHAFSCVSSPHYLTSSPPSPPVPRSLISVSVYLSRGSPCTLYQFLADVWCPPWIPCFSRFAMFQILILFFFYVWFELFCWFELCLFVLLCFSPSFTFSPGVSVLFFPYLMFLGYSALITKAHIWFSPTLPPWVCIWVHLQIPSPPDSMPITLSVWRCFTGIFQLCSFFREHIICCFVKGAVHVFNCVVSWGDTQLVWTNLCVCSIKEKMHFLLCTV